jgi:hypothetical protein
MNLRGTIAPFAVAGPLALGRAAWPLTKLAIDAPAAGEMQAGKWVFTVTGYGQRAAQTKPRAPSRRRPPRAMTC